MGVMIRRSLLVLAVCAASACSGSSDDAVVADADAATSDVVTTDDPDLSGDDLTASTAEMREVPTVPPSTIDGQTEAASDGVIVAAPTIAPLPPPVVDPDQSADPVAAPTTDLVGDPQPSPDATVPAPLPPPEGAAPPPEACVILADFGVLDRVSSVSGSNATEDRLDAQACRYVAGAVTVEVYFLPASVIRDDWYRRAGIEPVGEVGGDAVGFGSFVTPSGASGSGYTIAISGGGGGAVVAVSGPDARRVAAEVAPLAQQAAS